MRQLFLTDEQLWRAIAENTTELSNLMDREVETPGNWRGANKAGPIQQIAAAISGLYCRTSPSLFVSGWWPMRYPTSTLTQRHARVFRRTTGKEVEFFRVFR